jgi:hypothetical protein
MTDLAALQVPSKCPPTKPVQCNAFLTAPGLEPQPLISCLGGRISVITGNYTVLRISAVNHFLT